MHVYTQHRTLQCTCIAKQRTLQYTCIPNHVHYNTRVQPTTYTTIHVYSQQRTLQYTCIPNNVHYNTRVQPTTYTTIHVYSQQRTLQYTCIANNLHFNTRVQLTTYTKIYRKTSTEAFYLACDLGVGTGTVVYWSVGKTSLRYRCQMTFSVLCLPHHLSQFFFCCFIILPFSLSQTLSIFPSVIFSCVFHIYSALS